MQCCIVTLLSIVVYIYIYVYTGMCCGVKVSWQGDSIQRTAREHHSENIWILRRNRQGPRNRYELLSFSSYYNILFIICIICLVGTLDWVLVGQGIAIHYEVSLYCFVVLLFVGWVTHWLNEGLISWMKDKNVLISIQFSLFSVIVLMF